MSDWILQWADEFDDDGLPDPRRWSYDAGGHGWGNSELQHYTRERAENARVEGGRLIIEARKETWEDSAFTSARLVSKGEGDWTYGRIEVRAKLPAGRGTWPAIWMLPSTPDRRWPDDGEIDIMEHVGHDPGIVHASIHTTAYNHVRSTQKTATIAVPDAQDAFHVYSVEWTRLRVTCLIDDFAYFSYDRAPDATKDEWPFDHDFHLVLNVAVGGSWGDTEGIDETAFPARLEIDYVRVLQRPKP